MPRPNLLPYVVTISEITKFGDGWTEDEYKHKLSYFKTLEKAREFAQKQMAKSKIQYGEISVDLIIHMYDWENCGFWQVREGEWSENYDN